MKYNDASWHYGGNFPSDLPEEAGATHIGMFVAWCMLNGLAGSIHTDEFPEDLESLRSHRITPGQFLIKACDEKFTDEDLTDEGNEFAQAYYQDPPTGTGQYLDDYEKFLGQGLPTVYHVQDTWENYDKFAPVITKRFKDWKEGGPSGLKTYFDEDDFIGDKPWWKFW